MGWLEMVGLGGCWFLSDERLCRR
uniref:Uncharacterized protein n=1 Tax=Arundo donax TaxID=35708 RepID=A0A0A9A604_ARUDO